MRHEEREILPIKMYSEISLLGFDADKLADARWFFL
jgi:hypothetical protein